MFADEASGQGFGLYDQLRQGGIECHVLAPTKMAKTPGERKRKTDDRDAEKILDLVRASVLAGTSLPTVWVPGWQTRDDREVARQRVTVADKRCKLKSQVQSLLKRCDLRKPVEVKASWEIGHEFTQPAMKSLSELRSEEVVTPADQSPRLTTIIRLPSGVQQPPPLWRAGSWPLTSVGESSESGSNSYNCMWLRSSQYMPMTMRSPFGCQAGSSTIDFLVLARDFSFGFAAGSRINMSSVLSPFNPFTQIRVLSGDQVKFQKTC